MVGINIYIYIHMNLQSGLSNGYHAELQSSIHIFLKMIQWKVIGVLGGNQDAAGHTAFFEKGWFNQQQMVGPTRLDQLLDQKRRFSRIWKPGIIVLYTTVSGLLELQPAGLARGTAVVREPAGADIRQSQVHLNMNGEYIYIYYKPWREKLLVVQVNVRVP